MSETNETPTEKPCTICCSPRQLTIIRDAVEFYSRFLSGQIEAIPNELRFPVNRRGDSDEMLEAVNKLKSVLFPELHPNESYSIGRNRDDSLNDLRNISYEIYRQIYVFQTRQRAAAGEEVDWNVYSSPTMRYSDEKLITIEEIENDERN